MKLQTTNNGGDTSGGYILNVNGTNPHAPGGMAISVKPDYITGYYKYDLKGNDSMLMMVAFKKNGKTTDSNIFFIRNTTGSITSYTKFQFKVRCNTTPDTVLLAFTSSDFEHKTNAYTGSTVYLDDLAFTGSVTMPAIPNGDFENWATAGIDNIGAWSVEANVGGLSKTTDAYKGNYALKLTTEMNGDGTISPSLILNGIPSKKYGPPNGGRPFTNKIDTLFFYYKYTSSGNDSAEAQLSFRGASGFNMYDYRLPVASSYTYYQIPINLSFAPDSMLIRIQSSAWNGKKTQIGNILIIDEIQLKSDTLHTIKTGINTTKSIVSTPHAFPNPANDKIRIIPPSEMKNKARISVYNSIGELVYYREAVEANTGIEISLDGFKQGIYVYRIISEDYSSGGNFIKK